MTEPDAGQVQPVTTVVPAPKRRVFRRLTWGGRWADFAWRWTQRALFYNSPTPAYGWRRLILRCFGAKVHRSVMVHPTVRIIHPWNLTLEPGVAVLHNVVLDCQAPVVVGAGTRISQFSHLCTATHVYDDCRMPIIGQPIAIGTRCWLAADVFVGSGVTVGDGSVLGARCSVFRDVPGGVVVAGTPAHVIRSVDEAVAGPADGEDV